MVLGSHVAQAGSYNGPDYARFDFTHFEKPSAEQLKEVERLVNTWIEEDLPITTQVLPIEEAKKTGAIALFDEKYGDEVRVVSMGDVSKEFCAGTHASNTGDLGVFRIISEESVGSGVRRITCETKMKAYEDFRAQQDTLSDISALLHLKDAAGIIERIQHLQEENAKLRKAAAAADEKAMLADTDAMLNKAEDFNGIKLLFAQRKDMDPSAMKDYASALRAKLGESVVFVTSVGDGKVTFVCASSKGAIARGLKAGNLVKAAAQVCGGNGGGRPDMAQAGGKDSSKVAEAEDAVRALVKAA